MTATLDDWWKSCFKRLLDAEQHRGVIPSAMEPRWLALNQHVYPGKQRPRWAVGFQVPEIISHFLDDADIRSKDRAYAERQWAAAREWLNA